MRKQFSKNQSGGLENILSQASFWAPLRDKGSGEVDLTLARGSGSATFTRATTATTVGPTGLVVAVGSGVPRSYYDPTTGAYLGYLAEGARTNLCLRSEEFDNASWTKTRATVTANATTAPDGTTTADKIVEDGTAASSHIAYQTLSFTDATVYTYSVFAKAGERTWIALEELASGAGASAFTYINLSTGAAGTTAAAHTVRITTFPNGWYRVSITFTASGTSARNAGWRIVTGDNTATHDGDGTSGVYLWGAQLEAASFASSYIPTAGSTVTRNADVLTYPGTGNISASVGACYAELSTLWATSAVSAMAVLYDDLSGRLLFLSGPGTAATAIAFYDGVNVTQKSGITSMNTGVRKRAVTWGGSTASATGDGVVVGSGTFDGTLGGGSTTLVAVGGQTAAGNNWDGTIRNVCIWTKKLSDAMLQSLTA